MLITREQLHELVDSLPDDELKTAKRALEKIAQRPSLADFFGQAPYSDEELTPDDRAAIADGVADFVQGDVLTTEELRRELGLPPLDSK